MQNFSYYETMKMKSNITRIKILWKFQVKKRDFNKKTEIKLDLG